MTTTPNPKEPAPTLPTHLTKVTSDRGMPTRGCLPPVVAVHEGGRIGEIDVTPATAQHVWIRSRDDAKPFAHVNLHFRPVNALQFADQIIAVVDSQIESSTAWDGAVAEAHRVIADLITQLRFPEDDEN